MRRPDRNYSLALDLAGQAGFAQPVLYSLRRRPIVSWQENLPCFLARYDRSKTVSLMSRIGQARNRELRAVAAGSELTPTRLLEWLAQNDTHLANRQKALATLEKKQLLVRKAG